jgi:AraC-like DNA-binding protein
MKPIADPRYSEASAPPQISRFLLQHVAAVGRDPAMLCRGLGFEPDDLKKPDYRLSYRQSYLLVRRALHSLDDSGLGLAVGSRQTAVSWGLVGMAMLASPTLGEALDLAIRYQRHTGALLDCEMTLQGGYCRVQASTRFFDPEVAVFYLEEAFASALAIVRHLSGQDLVIDRVELEYPRPPHWQRYAEIFRCPVKFGAGHNLIQFATHWLELPLPTRDDYVAAEIAELLDSARWEQHGSSDLIETIQREVRKSLSRPPQLAELAQQLNLGERTLRRRIDEAGLSYHGIVDSVRRAKALALLSHRDSRLIDVASETGFSDVRNFRRAFKRWTGVTPRTAKQRIAQES